MSVSLNDSVGKWTSSLIIDFPASNISFLARILANENAETFGSFKTSGTEFTAKGARLLIGWIISRFSVISIISGSFSTTISGTSLIGVVATTVEISVIEYSDFLKWVGGII